MYIKTLSLTHFRGIKSIELDFDPRINVLIGVNGSGKTSVLDALAVMLSRLIGRISSTKGTGRFFTELEINNDYSELDAEITISLSSQDISWVVTKSRAAIKRQRITNLTDIRRVAAEIRESLQSDGNTINLPVAVFYSVNRAVIDVPLRIRTRHSFNQIEAYDLALTGIRNDFRLFFEWFRNREDLENEMKMDDRNFQDPQLKSVRGAIETFTGFTNLRIRRKPLRMELLKDGKSFDIRQMSDGEKSYLALTGDLARRLAIANPGLNNALEGEGVVLIDEVDLHLHPTWQSEIITRFTKIFPNCQLIVSSHSPFVINHVKPESVFLFNQIENKIVYEKANESYGKTADRILEDLMGLLSTRPKEVAEKLSKIYQLIDQGEIEPAKNKISELTKEIGADPELVKAEVLLKRKGIIGR